MRRGGVEKHFRQDLLPLFLLAQTLQAALTRGETKVQD
jgi:hypothetical protein